MRYLTLPEYRTRAYDPLPLPIAAALADTRLVTVAATLDGRTQLTSSSRVGVVRVGHADSAVELRVRPKTQVRRLLWLLGHAENPAGWREDWPVGLVEERDIVPAVAVSFAAATSRALSASVLQGYRVVEEALPVLRGRLREADQLRIRLGLPVPAEIRYDDYSIDVPENQLLLSAALRLLHIPGVPAATRRAIHRIVAALADVTTLIPGRLLPAITETRLNRRYQPALRLARLILTGRSVEHPPGDLDATGFVFDLNRVFEEWLTASLGEALRRGYGGRVEAQHRLHLDEDGAIEMRPDITWWSGEHCRAIIDAKYKAVRPSELPNADVYQMLAYCTALGLDRGHLVYAAGNEQPAQYSIVRAGAAAGVEITVHAVDLDAPIPRLLEQVEYLAETVAR